MSREMLYGYLAVAAMVAVPAATSAAPVSIINHSFEIPMVDPPGETPDGLILIGTPIDGWVKTSANEVGVWDIGAFPYGCWTVPAPDGNQVAYAAYLLTNQGISQVLSDNVQPNTIYTLTAYAGSVRDPANPAGPSKYAVPQTISLLGQGGGGDEVLATTTFTAVTGEFELVTLTFDSTGSSHVGLPLKISLMASEDQVAWDDIRLDASPVPEPTSALMIISGIGACVLIRSAKRRNRNVG